MAITAASTAAKMQQQSARNDAIEESAETRQEQRNRAATQKQFERSRQARRERARIQAMAGENGVGGNSVGLQLADSRFQESRDKQSIATNAQFANQATRNQANAQMGSVGGKALKGGLSIASTAAKDPQIQDDLGFEPRTRRGRQS